MPPRSVPGDTPPLSLDERHDVLDLLRRGASPFGACQTLELDSEIYFRTIACDPEFRRQVREVGELLTQNVIATVYRKAIEGVPAAQALWLRTFARPGDDPSSPASESNDGLKDLSEDELELQLRAYRAILARRTRAPLEDRPAE